MNIKKSSYYPIDDMEGKSNFKRYYRIEENGEIFERILLCILNPSLREKIICAHFLRNYVKVFLNETLDIEIISRDKPWDFKVCLSTNETFNIEITSIAENQKLFEKFKSEERFIKGSLSKKIPFFELEKLNKLFPNKDITSQIKALKESKIKKQVQVKNPYYEVNLPLFISGFTHIKAPLEVLLQEAIKKKEQKKHLEKENTVLVIDNRTLTYEIQEFYKAKTFLENYLKTCSFKEIWFYTGYCSDNDGNNSEFSLSPLKISNSQTIIMSQPYFEKEKNENNTVYIDKTYRMK